MSLNAIVLLPVLAGFGLLYWGSTLSDEEWFLRLMFQFLFIPLCWVSVNLGVIDAQLVYSADVELVSTLSSVAEYLGYLFFGLMAYYFFVTIGRVRDMLQQRRVQRMEERHGEG